MSTEDLLNNIIDSVELDKLSRAGLINEIRIRNIRIKKEFMNLRRVMRPMDALEFLANKYFRSVSTIQAIVYRKKGKSKLCQQ